MPWHSAQMVKVMDHQGSRNKDVVLLQAPREGAARGPSWSRECSAGSRAVQGGSMNPRPQCAPPWHKCCTRVSSQPQAGGPSRRPRSRCSPCAPTPRRHLGRSSASPPVSIAPFFQPTRKTQSLAAAGPNLLVAFVPASPHREDRVGPGCTRGSPGPEFAVWERMRCSVPRGNQRVGGGDTQEGSPLLAFNGRALNSFRVTHFLDVTKFSSL